MIDLLNTILGSQIDYQSIFSLIAIYLAALWLMLCLWVFMDAYKRYDKFLTAFLISLVVFLFNFPALIFYLIVRPEEDLLHELLHEEAYGGVNVPLINFTGKDGDVKMTFALHIANQPVDADDMKITVDWDSKDPRFSLNSRNKKQDRQDRSSEDEPQKESLFSKFNEGIKAQVSKLKSAAEKSIEETDSSEDKQSSDSEDNNKKTKGSDNSSKKAK